MEKKHEQANEDAKKQGDEKSQEAYQAELQNVAEKVLAGQFDMQKYYGLTDDGLETIYALGHEMFSHKQYDKAFNIFLLLSILKPDLPKYTTASGLACYMKGNYESAADFFRAALLSGGYTTKNLIRIAECSLKLERFEETIVYLDEIISIANSENLKDDSDVQMHSVRAKMMKVFSEKRIKELAEEASKQSAEETDSGGK
jgi:tetratricopeptide (TPR) repeat protein